MLVCFLIGLSICPPVYPAKYSFLIHPSIHSSFPLSIIYLPIQPSTHLGNQSFFYQLIYLSIYPSLHSSIIRSSEYHDQGWVLET